MKVARLVPAGVFLFCSALAQATTITVDCDAGGKVQTAVDVARPGDTILVRGVCNENVRILDEAARITLDGQKSTTIHSPSPTANTILVAGRNITIKGFTITGGRFGIAVLRGGTVLIDTNTIQDNSDSGINVAQHSFARIVSSIIQLNAAAGIRVIESSYARVGFLDLETVAPAGNTIRKNGAVAGILVQRSSGASLAGNTISDNQGPGVVVTGASHADLAGNHIDANSSDGVALSENSDVQLGDEAGPLGPANDTTAPNAGFGLHCSGNSSVSGFLATLNGVGGAKRFDGSCTNRLDRGPEDEEGAPVYQWQPTGHAPGQKPD